MAGISWDDQKSTGDPLKRGAAALLSAVLVAGFAPAANASQGQTVPVIVRAAPGQVAAAIAAVEAQDGVVAEMLDLIDGFAAQVPSVALDGIEAMPQIVSVTPDATLVAHSTASENADARTVTSSAQAVGVDALWSQGFDGSGVDVAIIDSGVTTTALAGRVTYGPDLSFTSENPDLHNRDLLGHGTHLAGIIAGAGDASVAGVAPGAGIVSVKVAGEDGITDVSQVIAGIDWVVHHRRANGLNIRVLNLAYGTDGAQPAAIDPLAYAAEQAWKAGIVVVVAAGNEGTALGRLNNPASAPTLLAVGAVDVKGTDSIKDDTVPSWSSRGDGNRNPDLVAPGISVLGSAAPGTPADAAGQRAGLSRGVTRGSGTSQATAFVAGSAALLVDAHPTATPDEIKAALVNGAKELKDVDPRAGGNGVLQVDKAHKVLLKGAKVGSGSRWSDGSGSLDGARGRATVSRDGVVLEGQHTVFGAFDRDAWAEASASGSTWSGSTWSGSTWSGGSWLGSTWSGSTWSGSTWSGSTWSGSTWSGSTWSGSTWSGSTWSGSTWSTTEWR